MAEHAAEAVTPSPTEAAPWRYSPYTQSPVRRGLQESSSIVQTPAQPIGHIRVSPYPQRLRTPSQHVQRQTTTEAHRAVSVPQRADQPYQLLVKPLVKATVSQRDTSGLMLDAYVASGRTFRDILKKIWDEFKPRLKGVAAKTDTGWTQVATDIAEWASSMHLRYNKKVIDASKTEQESNQWLVKMKDKTVMLIIFEYGTTLGRQQDFDDSSAQCLRPELTDRAGAVAEASLRDVVASLQAQWSATFQAEQVVWRM